MGNTQSSLGLDAYAPRMAVEWDLDTPDVLWRETDATYCFVDISGFTALSERLARRGRIGAEELTEVLNHVFSRMLEVAYQKGGALLKFGGDALLLAFMGDDHATMAAESAVAMRAALREARTLPTSVGRVNLRMSIGVHSGAFHAFRVGDPHSAKSSPHHRSRGNHDHADGSVGRRWRDRGQPSHGGASPPGGGRWDEGRRLPPAVATYGRRWPGADPDPSDSGPGRRVVDSGRAADPTRARFG